VRTASELAQDARRLALVGRFPEHPLTDDDRCALEKGFADSGRPLLR